MIVLFGEYLQQRKFFCNLCVGSSLGAWGNCLFAICNLFVVCDKKGNNFCNQHCLLNYIQPFPVSEKCTRQILWSAIINMN